MRLSWGEIKLRKESLSKYFSNSNYFFPEEKFVIVASPVFGDSYSAISWIYRELRRIAIEGGSINEFGAFSPIQYGYTVNSRELDDSYTNLIGGSPYKLLSLTNGKYNVDIGFNFRKQLLNSNFGELNDVGLPVGFEKPFFNDFSFGDSTQMRGGKRRIGLDEPLIRVKNKEQIEDLKSEINSITEVCCNKKRWTIPSGAVLDTRLEKFRLLELIEEDDAVLFIFREEDDFFTCTFDLSTFEWDLSAVNIGWDDSISELIEEHRVTINYLCCVILHDFWVPEIRERNQLYSPRKVLSSTIGKWAKPADDDMKSIKYLPRVIYENKQLQTGLFEKVYSGYTYRRRAHERNLNGKKASVKQLLLATQYGLRIPKGYTFVKPTNVEELVDENPKDTYVSRTLLSKLYSVEVFEDSTVKIKWQQFEYDVKEWMMELGFKIIPGKWSKHGDKGIDVKAFGPRDELWIIQCKCWSKNRKVGPDVLREIWGSQRQIEKEIDIDFRKTKIRTAIVTTSSFSDSDDFITAAEQQGTLLIDGEMFSKREWPEKK